MSDWSDEDETPQAELMADPEPAVTTKNALGALCPL